MLYTLFVTVKECCKIATGRADNHNCEDCNDAFLAAPESMAIAGISPKTAPKTMAIRPGNYGDNPRTMALRPVNYGMTPRKLWRNSSVTRTGYSSWERKRF